jgi:hypothetical protein
MTSGFDGKGAHWARVAAEDGELAGVPDGARKLLTLAEGVFTAQDVLHVAVMIAEAEAANGFGPTDDACVFARKVLQLGDEAGVPNLAVEVPGTLVARWDTGDQMVTGWTFTPSAGAAGYFGPSVYVSDDTMRFGVDDDTAAKLADNDGPFWHNVRTQLASQSAEILVEWSE